MDKFLTASGPVPGVTFDTVCSDWIELTIGSAGHLPMFESLNKVFQARLLKMSIGLLLWPFPRRLELWDSAFVKESLRWMLC